MPVSNHLHVPGTSTCTNDELKVSLSGVPGHSKQNDELKVPERQQLRVGDHCARKTSVIRACVATTHV